MDKKIINNGLAIFTGLGFLAVLLLVEWLVLKIILLVLGLATVGFLFFNAHYKQTDLSYEIKPMRRLAMIIWSFNLFCFLSLTFGLNQFFSTMPFWLISLPVVFLVGLISIKIWQMYFNVPVQNFLPWAIILSLSLWEVVWVISLLPLGYFVSGVLSTWVWYVISLFIRFHLGPQKIIWRKQSWFLGINILLFLLVLLFFVRWI